MYTWDLWRSNSYGFMVPHQNFDFIIFVVKEEVTLILLSAHSLRIEKGSHQGIPRHNRTCPRCSSNEVEDELHFLLTCSALHNERESQCITDNFINLIKLANKDNFIWLMNNENKDILITLCSYIQNNERCG